MRRADPAISRHRDSYHVVTPGQPINGKGYSDKMLALLAAQTHLEHQMSPATSLHVVRQSLFGPATTLYTIWREEDTDAICTLPVERED